ncbi:hypothetical protein BDN72DRAFT_865437 [Pluteus cervinus]|uniref:Uncharacterized protein n=1 Tax=Pluteus cervinus TaxID=181527 RepID=A0ACD2ZZV7_9AGAR|nr:hypothetical protein BDN72DRAFT_865437 [Pluteus cervinus]
MEDARTILIPYLSDSSEYKVQENQVIFAGDKTLVDLFKHLRLRLLDGDSLERFIGSCQYIHQHPPLPDPTVWKTTIHLDIAIHAFADWIIERYPEYYLPHSNEPTSPVPETQTGRDPSETLASPLSVSQEVEELKRDHEKMARTFEGQEHQHLLQDLKQRFHNMEERFRASKQVTKYLIRQEAEKLDRFQNGVTRAAHVLAANTGEFLSAFNKLAHHIQVLEQNYKYSQANEVHSMSSDTSSPIPSTPVPSTPVPSTPVPSTPSPEATSRIPFSMSLSGFMT